VGLTILVALGILGVSIMWLTNFFFGGRSFKATIVFPNAGGMTVGTRVAYRGVKIGQIVAINPEPEGVALEVEIRPANRLIPANSLIEATQAGLVGETSVDIIPLQPLPPGGVTAKPLEQDCDPTIIICNGSRLQGEGKLDVNTLIRSLMRIANIISEPAVTSAVRTMFQKSSDALGKFSSLSQNADLLLQDLAKNNTVDNLNSTFSSINSMSDQAENVLGEADKKGLINNLDSTLNSIKGFSQKADGLLAEAEAQDTINQLNSTLTAVGGAAEQIEVFMAVNKSQIANTIASIGQASEEMSGTLTGLNPMIAKIEQGQFVDNLETISANAADLTANLKDFSTELNDPATIIQLQRLLDSARFVFENVNKITSEIDEITGDPQLREEIIRLIRGLSNLVSSTQQLQQQLEYAQMLHQVALSINSSQPFSQNDTSANPSTTVPSKP
jgi:phospholipid/cholesterol/gamma-HCH transport system substrate-binding protein